MNEGQARRDQLEMLQGPLERLPDPLPLPTLRPGERFRVCIRPPGSKSLTNRAILLAALATGRSTLQGALTDAEDAQVMLRAVRALGADVDVRGETVTITGCGGRWRAAAPVVLDLANAGTATRFLAAAVLLSPVAVTLDGAPRMRERPIGDLAEALTALGCTVEWLGAPGCPPLRITPPASPASGRVVELRSVRSSQFVSALLLTAPFVPGGLTLRLLGGLTSGPYVEMTLALLARVGVSVRNSLSLDVLRVWRDEPGLEAFTHEIEPDASGATYFWAAAAMTPGAACRVPGLRADSLQGDAGFPGLLARMGASATASENGTEVTGPARLQPILADMQSMPDAAMTLAAAACAAPGTSILRGLATLHDKECDRVRATVAELRKLGARVENPVAGDPDAITITPGELSTRPVHFDTYKDHRMAMSLALLALRRPNVYIRDPGCVSKTYPGFWRDFASLFGGTG